MPHYGKAWSFHSTLGQKGMVSFTVYLLWDIAGVVSKEQLQYSTYIDLL
jgi:hypothetical protein